MNISFEEFYYKWIKPMITLTIIIGYLCVVEFIFGQIYDGFTFNSFSYYYNKAGNKYEIWYMGLIGPLRFGVAYLTFRWERTEQMLLKQFLIIVLFLLSITVLDIAYIINAADNVKYHRVFSSFNFAPFLDLGVTVILTTLLQFAVLLVHLVKISDITRRFNHFTHFEPTFYNIWVGSVWLPLLVIGIFTCLRFIFLYLYGCAFATLSFKKMIKIEMDYRKNKFYATLITGPVEIFSAIICYNLTKSNKSRRSLVAFIICSGIQIFAFIMTLRALYEIILSEENYLWPNFLVCIYLCDSIFSGTMSALIVTALGLNYNSLRRFDEEQQVIMHQKKFKKLALDYESEDDNYISIN